MADFQQIQYQFTQHLRQPDSSPVPDALEDRRMGIYRDLIYNNIESFISGGFPILRSILVDKSWHAMVRDFVAHHQSQTPYFLEISQEFLHYLMHERGEINGDPAFLLELAHYEWVELALDVAVETIPDFPAIRLSALDARPQVSSLVWCLSYRYPVHLIGPDYQPTEAPAQPCYLVVYRNRNDDVKFMEANAVTVRLIQLLQEQTALRGGEALSIIANELKSTNHERLLTDGKALLEKLFTLDIIVGLVE